LGQSRWALNTSEDVAPGVFEIPGVKFDGMNSRFTGTIDGIAAVAKILGSPELPPKAVLSQIDIELKKDLRDYQKGGVITLLGRLKQYGGAILADDVGLGKTRQTIETAENLGGRTMVVCPAFVRETWRDEIQKWNAGTVAVLGPGTSKQTKKEWEDAKEAWWIITSYELADRAYDAGFTKGVPTLLVMDEAHCLRGRFTQRNKRLTDIAAMARYRLALTGTPMWSRPRDFYALLAILLGRTFGSRGQFDLRYCGAHINQWGGWENKGATNTDELKLRLSYYMLRRTREDVLKELPSLTRQVVWVPPSKEAEQAFHHAIVSKTAGAVPAALQACLEAKIDAALDYAEQAKKFILFTYLKTHAHQMAKMLMEQRETPCVCITGDMTHAARKAAVTQAQSQGWGIVATIDSLWQGVNLQGVANIGIMHTLDYVPVKMVQAEGRIHRMGQKLPVTWVYLACKDSMDALVIRTIVDKMDQLRQVMGADNGQELRNSLNADVNGGGDEKAALRQIFDAMEEA
jgi:SWI/SNF-related matrix-associated actin-dependent regulator 1 of chromatin subfamily A